MDLLLIYFFIAGYVFLQIIWLFLDPRPGVQRFRSLITPTKRYRQVLLLLMFLFILLQLLFPTTFTFPIQWEGQTTLLWYIGGVTLYVLGAGFAIWARLTMQNRWLPAGEGHNSKTQNKLFTSGPFAYSRNPIYVGLLLMYIGACLGLRTYYIVLILFPLLMFLSSIRDEENILEKQFGDEYREYKNRVRRFI